MTTLAKYTYLGVSSVVQVDYAEPEVRYDLATNGTSSNPYGGLDRFGRVVDLLWEKYSGTPEDLVRLQYGYDRVSNRTWREDLVAQSYSKDFDELYAYDGMHRLQDMQRGLLNSGHTAMENGTLEFQQEWSLDTTGNWSGFNEDNNGSGSWTLEQTRTHNEVNEITAIAETVGPAWVTPQHDRNGNMTLMPQPADPTESFTATYDAWNRLVKLVDDSTTVAEYIYDGQNWRTQKTLPEETRHFFYSSAWQVVEERLGVSTDPEQQYVWGLRYIDDLILRDRDTDANGTLDERLYGMQDGNWNVVAVASPSSTVEERFNYRAYGILTSYDAFFENPQPTSRLSLTYTFTSRRLDEESQLMYYRARMYIPAIGRFIQRDPIEYTGGTNIYCAYFIPNGFDPFGLHPLIYFGVGAASFVSTVVYGLYQKEKEDALLYARNRGLTYPPGFNIGTFEYDILVRPIAVQASTADNGTIYVSPLILGDQCAVWDAIVHEWVAAFMNDQLWMIDKIAENPTSLQSFSNITQLALAHLTGIQCGCKTVEYDTAKTPQIYGTRTYRSAREFFDQCCAGNNIGKTFYATLEEDWEGYLSSRYVRFWWKISCKSKGKVDGDFHWGIQNIGRLVPRSAMTTPKWWPSSHADEVKWPAYRDGGSFVK